MKQDITTIKRILDAFVEHPDIHVRWDELETSVGLPEPDLIFHVEILMDRGMIVPREGGPGLALVDDSGRLEGVMAGQRLRLTAAGHDFRDALATNGMLEKVKQKAGDAGIDAVIAAVTTLARQGATALLLGG